MTDPERDALDIRPTADAMLARIRLDGVGPRGRLRVYLGMAPGVGKTYRMLEEGHRRLDRGTDVAVGFAETHQRAVVSRLLDGIEVVPRRRIEYRGVVVEEMDIDALLERRPTVALVDELAHTNVPGSDNEKRWQDVDQILESGIHVVSTLNVQHLDSVADAVATITGAPVNERLPDAFLERADEIELVDMSPHALRQRMKHGNVYPSGRAEVALEKFFTEANLTALRELALRFVARRVEGQLEDTSAARRLDLVTERVVVLIDGSPASARAIRRAADLAGVMHAGLLAVVVETPEMERLSYDRARDLQEAIDDAVDLGAQLVRIEAKDTVTGLVDVSRSRGAKHVVIAHAPTKGLSRLRGPSLLDQLLEHLPELEVHVVGSA
jgi:two-component system sensor histidine kinase KdpD